MIDRALRRFRQRCFIERHRRRVVRWAERDGRRGTPWNEGQVARVTIREAARHGTCCAGHQHPVFRPRYRREPWAPDATDLL